MFVGSAKTSEEMLLKIANTQISLSGKGAFDKFMSEKYPNCYEHYKIRRKKFNTTWEIQPSRLIYLFESVDDKPLVLDYVLVSIDPKPKQAIEYRAIDNVIDSVKGKRLIDILGWYMSEDGFEKKYEVYER